MKKLSTIRALGVLTVVLLASPPAAYTGGQMPSVPQPGPEHELLKKDVGTWDAVVEVVPAPGAPAEKSKGVEVNTMGCGGKCLITDFKADIMGTSFQGHGMATWDPAKKRYVGTWMDSMSTGPAATESTYDPATKTWTGFLEGPDMSGKVSKSRAVTEWKDDSTRVFTMYSTGPDGKEMQSLRITYTRRKT